MEGQLDGVKVRRILRQESEACANTPESFLDTSDFVGGPHWPPPLRINALDSLRRRTLGIPIHSGWDAL